MSKIGLLPFGSLQSGQGDHKGGNFSTVWKVLYWSEAGCCGNQSKKAFKKEVASKV